MSIHVLWRGLPAAAVLVACRAAAAATGEPGAPPGVSPEELRRLEESLAPPAPAPASMPAGGLANPDLAVVLDVAGAAFTDDSLPVGAHDPAGNGFTFQQLELTLGAAADPFFRVDASLVFVPEGVEVEEAYATSLALPADLQVRAGQFLTRFGRQNPTHPHTWQFVDTPLVLGKFFGSEGQSGVGVEASWLAPLPWFVELVASANGSPAGVHAHAGEEPEEEEPHGIEDPGDLLYTAALKQFVPVGQDFGLLVGVSSQSGPGHDGRTAIHGVDLLLRYRPVASVDRAAVSLQVEALHRTREHDGRSLEDAGGYAQLAWSIDPTWETAVRYEYVSGLAADRDWPAGRRRAAAQLTFHPSHFTRLRLQVNRDDPTYRGSPIDSAFLQLELTAGAHRAHPY